MKDIPFWKEGILKIEPYRSTPIADLLFRNFTLLYYFRPTWRIWHEFFVMDDFGNLTRVNINSGAHYRDMGDH
jgi:hypothetical protein